MALLAPFIGWQVLPAALPCLAALVTLRVIDHLRRPIDVTLTPSAFVVQLGDAAPVSVPRASISAVTEHRWTIRIERADDDPVGIGVLGCSPEVRAALITLLTDTRR